MDIQVEKEKRIKRLLEELPAEQVDEVIDFAEYLKARKKTGPSGFSVGAMGKISPIRSQIPYTTKRDQVLITSRNHRANSTVQGLPLESLFHPTKAV
jgi:hypothetical protein